MYHQWWCVHCVTSWNLKVHIGLDSRQRCQYLEGRNLQGSPFIVSPLSNYEVARLPDAVQRAVHMGKLVELHTGSAGTFDHPLLQVVRGVGVVIQDMSVQG